MSDTAFQVVIAAEEGFSEDHADLIRRELLRDGYHEDAVTVEEVSK